jgi:hypothetical protein
MPSIYFEHNGIERPKTISQAGPYADKSALEKNQFNYALWDMSRIYAYSQVIVLPEPTIGPDALAAQRVCVNIMRLVDDRQAELVRVRVRLLNLDDAIFEHYSLRAKGEWMSSLAALEEHFTPSSASSTRSSLALSPSLVPMTLPSTTPGQPM